MTTQYWMMMMRMPTQMASTVIPQMQHRGEPISAHLGARQPVNTETDFTEATFAQLLTRVIIITIIIDVAGVTSKDTFSKSV